MKLFCNVIILILSISTTINAQNTSESKLKMNESEWNVGIVQAELSWNNVDENLKNHSQRIGKFANCQMIIFPELFVSGCLMKQKSKKEAVEQKEKIAERYLEVVDSLKSWAIKTNAIVMGSTVYKENNLFYNRLIAAFPSGEIAYYDKHNCFKKGGYTPGNEQLILNYKGMKIATYICYDLRFSEWSKNKNTYDIAVYVANWPESRGEDWTRLIRERASENEAYVVGVNCVGVDSNGLKYAGESVIVAPSGDVIHQCKAFEEELVEVDILNIP